MLTAARVSALLHPSTCHGVAEEQGNCVALSAFTIQACDGSAKTKVRAAELELVSSAPTVTQSLTRR